ncbi:hypothetical protein V1264_010217 [Littorina saxatilis]|uniref:Uncharacterized protein n=1 Tax=Littorina saxatilis TaxID=31220 RepID=A0AAN9AP49_9CAEN
MPRFSIRRSLLVDVLVLVCLALALLGFLYVTGLLAHVPLLNRLVALRDGPVVITPLPPKVIHGHGVPPKH